MTVPMNWDNAAQEFGGTEVLEEVLAGFLERADEQIAGLRAALARGEREVLRRTAHALRGGAATLEANPLAQAAARLEEASVAADAQMLQSMVGGIAEELQRLNEYIRASRGHAELVTHEQSGR
jgi:HPt (histidine-containing phosphotransfer) domain-containing protein